ncbi:hypothetical protein pdam_00022901, partial [Pocillopora damicornis]
MHATVCMIFKKCHNAVNSEIKQAREKFFKNVLNENEGNSSMTWQIIDKSTLRKIHSSSIKEIKLDKSSISDLLELLSAFNDHFSSIGLKLIDTIQQNYVKETKHRFKLKTTDCSTVFLYYLKHDLLKSVLIWSQVPYQPFSIDLLYLVFFLLNANADDLLVRLGWQKLYLQQGNGHYMVYKSLNDLTPDYLKSLFGDWSAISSYSLRNCEGKLDPLPHTNFLKNSFSYNGAYYAIRIESIYFHQHSYTLKQKQELFTFVISSVETLVQIENNSLDWQALSSAMDSGEDLHNFIR